MCTFFLIDKGASQAITDAAGFLPVHYARANKHSMTEQIAESAHLHITSKHSPDIKRFLESFGFVSQTDLFNAFQDISTRMSTSLNMATDELTSDDDPYSTDHSFDDALDYSGAARRM